MRNKKVATIRKITAICGYQDVVLNAEEMKLYQKHNGTIELDQSSDVDNFYQNLENVGKEKGYSIKKEKNEYRLTQKGLPRNYKAELRIKIEEGKIFYNIKPTKFSDIYTKIWIVAFIIMLIFPWYFFLSAPVKEFPWPLLLIEGFGILILIIVYNISIDGYKNETDKLRNLIKKMISTEHNTTYPSGSQMMK